MKRVKTFSEKIELLDSSGLMVVGWRKKCPVCNKTYETTSRSQKFCSSECCKKSQARHRKHRKDYDLNKEVIRLSSRSHSIATEVISQLVALGVISYQCSCGATEHLQVHHVNLNWLDNTPSNLQVVCPKCHAEIHSKLEASLKEQGRSLEDFYDSSFRPILSLLNKNIQ